MRTGMKVLLRFLANRLHGLTLNEGGLTLRKRVWPIEFDYVLLCGNRKASTFSWFRRESDVEPLANSIDKDQVRV